MNPALLRCGSSIGLLLAVATFGCAKDDQTLSILQMEAVTEPSCMAQAVASATGLVGRDRGVLDVTLVGTSGYIATPVIRNNLISNVTNTIEMNSIQLTGVNVNLQLPAVAAGAVPASELAFFYASAAGRLDPAGIAPMFAEVLPAMIAKQLAGSIPKNGLLTVIAQIQPIGIHDGDQVVGGSIYFPIDLCKDCLVSNRSCPFPAGSTPAIGGCFPQQDDPLQCCTDTTGAVFCGAAAPVGAPPASQLSDGPGGGSR